jgi:negative regulator of flagellin synthesis FlgM
MKIPGETAVPARISGSDTKAVRVASGSAVHKRPEQSAGKAGSSTDSTSDVQLTGASRNLAAIEQTLRAMPAVDELRVAAVKQRLDSGDYQVDPQRVADKLLHLESEFQRGGPLEHNLLK